MKSFVFDVWSLKFFDEIFWPPEPFCGVRCQCRLCQNIQEIRGLYLIWFSQNFQHQRNVWKLFKLVVDPLQKKCRFQTLREESNFQHYDMVQLCSSAFQPFDENMEFIPLEQRHPDVLLFRGFSHKIRLNHDGNIFQWKQSTTKTGLESILTPRIGLSVSCSSKLKKYVNQAAFRWRRWIFKLSQARYMNSENISHGKICQTQEITSWEKNFSMLLVKTKGVQNLANWKNGKYFTQAVSWWRQWMFATLPQQHVSPIVGAVRWLPDRNITLSYNHVILSSCAACLVLPIFGDFQHL